MAAEGGRGHILNDPLFTQAKQSLTACMRVENPKVEGLTKILNQQLEANPNSRIIVFTQYRDTVKAVLRRLEKRHQHRRGGIRAVHDKS